MSEFEELYKVEEAMRLRFREVDEQLLQNFQQILGDTFSEDFLRRYLLLEGAEDRDFVRDAAQFSGLLYINDVQVSFSGNLNDEEIESLSLWSEDGEFARDFYISSDDDSYDGEFLALRAERAIKGQRASALYLFSKFYGGDELDFQAHFLPDVRAYFLSVLSRDVQKFQLDVPAAWTEKFQQEPVLNKSPEVYDDWNRLNGRPSNYVATDELNQSLRVVRNYKYCTSDESAVEFLRTQLIKFSQTPPYDMDPELFVDQLFGATDGQIRFS